MCATPGVPVLQMGPKHQRGVVTLQGSPSADHRNGEPSLLALPPNIPSGSQAHPDCAGTSEVDKPNLAREELPPLIRDVSASSRLLAIEGCEPNDAINSVAAMEMEHKKILEVAKQKKEECKARAQPPIFKRPAAHVAHPAKLAKKSRPSMPDAGPVLYQAGKISPSDSKGGWRVWSNVQDKARERFF